MLRGAGFAVGAAVLQLSPNAFGAPQFDLGAAPAACVRTRPTPTLFGFCLGTRADLWLLRERDANWGFGPYTELWTVQFEDLHLGAGISLLAPVWSAAPFVLSIGPAYDVSRLTPEGRATLFWGPTSYNFHSSYALTNGVFVSLERSLESAPITRISAGLRVDLLWLALPFVIAYEAARGS